MSIEFMDYSRIVDDYKIKIADLHSHLYIMSVITTLIALITMIFIVKVSPKEMSKYKWYLLNTVIFSTAVDMWLNLVMQPAVLLPSATLCVNGIMKKFSFLYLSLLSSVRKQ